MSREKMIRLKLGEPQPIDCIVCKAKHGYQVTDNVKGSYTTIYTEDGEQEMGAYADSMRTTFMTTKANCANCGHVLELIVER